MCYDISAKEALINGEHHKMPKLAMAYRDLKEKISDATVSGAPVSRTSTSGEKESVPTPAPEVLEGKGNSNNSNRLKS